LNLFQINLNSFRPGSVPPGPACQPVPLPGTVPPGPACQPVLRHGTVAAAHWSAPFPLRCLAGCAAWLRHAARARRTRATASRAPSANRPGPPSLSALACRVVPPHRSSPSSARQFKTVIVTNEPLLFPIFLPSSEAAQACLTPPTSYPPLTTGGF
jgi:hypothetical protein